MKRESDDPNASLKSSAMRTSTSILRIRQRTENELIAAKEALERKTAELANSLALLRATLESTSDAILVTDGSGHVAIYSESYVRMWRVPPEVMNLRDEEALRKIEGECVEDKQAFEERLAQIRMTMPEESVDLLEFADGRTIERHSRLQVGHEGRRVWLYRDITERRKAELTEKLLAALVDSSDDAIVGKDLNSIVTAWNAGAERIYGYTAREMIGQSIMRVIPPERQAEELEISARIRRGERVNHFETIRVSKGGRLINVSVTISPIKDAAGNVIGSSKIARDITARKRAEERLRSSEQRFHQLWATTTDAVIIMDRERHVEFANPSVATIFGYSPDEVTSMGLSALIPERLRPAHLAGVERLVHHGAQGTDLRSVETVGLHRDGHEFPVEISFSHFRDGDREMFAAFIRDISERKQAEAKLLAAKNAAEKASKAKDEFLAVLSHELRTPLTPALASASYLAMHERLPEELRDAAATIRRNVQLEARLIDDLLDLTRITRGKLELNTEPVDTHHLLQSTLEIVREDVARKHLQVISKLDAARHYVKADRVRLQQVFWNLINNAVKFSHHGGRIELRTWNESEDFLLEISDTGIGIQPEYQSLIFNAFEQGERSVTRQFGGLGLGLTISTTLLKLHGGAITVRSEGYNKGAAFTIRLGTLDAPPAVQGMLMARETRELRPLRLLLVDDHPDTLRVLAMLLRKRGHTVMTADCVQGALEVIRTEPIDVLISDIGLPDGSGYDLMREAKQLRPLRGIALSGFGMEQDVHLSMDSGYDCHLTKPVDFDELQTRLRALPPPASS
jgi:two-component system CheB/CheR fusion protein